MRMSAYDLWATQGPPDAEDELAYLEHEAREQGEADLLKDLTERGVCLECCAGVIITGWYAAGLGPIYGECPECAGTGKDLRGCPDCGLGHSIQACPAIKTLLMQEDT